MPIYEYQCEACGNETEAMQKVTDSPLTTCEKCSGKLTRLVSRTSFQLKGSGWYITDYKRSASDSKSGSSKKAAGAGASTASSDAASSGKTGGESKGESKN